MRLIRAPHIQLPLLGVVLLVALQVPLGVKSFLFPYNPHQLSCQKPAQQLPTFRNFAPRPANCLRQYSQNQRPVPLLASHKPQDDEDTPQPKKRSKRERIRAVARKVKKASLPLIAAFLFWSNSRMLPAQAATNHVSESTSSLHARAVGGTIVDEETLVSYQNQDTASEGTSTTSTAQQTENKSSKKAKSKSIYGDVEDDDFEDDFADLENDESIGKKPKTTVTEAEVARARKMQTNTAQQQYMSYKKTDPNLKRKVMAAVFIPFFGGQSLREFIRRRKEENYVQKGLEIMRAQEAEYFNITNTTDDSDVEDELKGLKNKDGDDDDDDSDDEDDDEDDDDSEDDDDDDEDDADDRRRGPKRPTRGGGPSGDGGGSSGSGGDYDPGYGKPSDEDTERLQNLFDKS